VKAYPIPAVLGLNSRWSTLITMEPLDDFRMQPEQEPPVPDAGGPSFLPYWIAAAALVLAVAIGGAWWYRQRPSAAANQAPSPDGAGQAAETGGAHAPLGPAVDPIELPPLVLTDPLVRDLLGQLSSSPTLASWLATDGLIRKAVASIENVAEGASPATHARVLAPRLPFAAETEGGTITIDPRSYARYDGIAGAVASLDPAGVARVYSLLKPRLAEAYADLGHPDADIDAAVERAVSMLLGAPVVEEPVVLRRRVLSYRYDRADFEALPAAQKQLLRMGPRNTRIIQEQLRAVARELGIPAGRLPPRQTAR